jgi:hypothetical protein
MDYIIHEYESPNPNAHKDDFTILSSWMLRLKLGDLKTHIQGWK